MLRTHRALSTRVVTLVVVLTLVAPAALAAAPASPAPVPAPRVTVGELSAGGVIVRASTIVAAPLPAVLGLLLDFGAHARLDPEVAKAQVLSRKGASTRVHVELAGHPLAPDLWYDARYTCRRGYDAAGRDQATLSFTQERGSFAMNLGSWKLETLADGRTRLSYRGKVDPGVPFAPSAVVASNVRDSYRSWMSTIRRVAPARPAAGALLDGCAVRAS